MSRLLSIARLALDFGRVNRATWYPDGLRPESDTDHTVMLGLLALHVGGRAVGLRLNLDKLSTLALVHDLAEVYAGDTNTLGGLTEAQKADKAAREAAAIERLRREIGGPIAWALQVYEAQSTPEARFLRYLDKITPKLTQAMNGCVQVRREGRSLGWLRERHRIQGEELRAAYPEFAEVLGPLFDEAAAQAEASLVEATAVSSGGVKTTSELLYDLAAAGHIVELCYHPAADPGDGSGWALTIGDRTTYGSLEACEARMREEAARG